MIMRLISEPCSRMLEILYFRNWGRSMQTCYTHILRGVRMYMPCVHRRKAIIPSATTFGGTVSAQKGKELRPNAKIVLQKLIKNSKAGLFCNTCKVSRRILLMLWAFIHCTLMVHAGFWYLISIITTRVLSRQRVGNKKLML